MFLPIVGLVLSYLQLTAASSTTSGRLELAVARPFCPSEVKSLLFSFKSWEEFRPCRENSKQSKSRAHPKELEIVEYLLHPFFSKTSESANFLSVPFINLFTLFADGPKLPAASAQITTKPSASAIDCRECSLKIGHEAGT